MGCKMHDKHLQWQPKVAAIKTNKQRVPRVSPPYSGERGLAMYFRVHSRVGIPTPSTLQVTVDVSVAHAWSHSNLSSMESSRVMR
jgi:hypothetical protein